MTRTEAVKYANEHNLEILHDGLKSMVESPVKRITDGFQPGYNWALGQYVGGRREYQKILSQRGLVEVGKDKPPPDGQEKRPFHDYEMKKEIKKIAPDISDKTLDSLD